MENFSEWLRKQLKDKRWRQADLARAANLDPAVISNLVNEIRGPGEDTCTAIARALDLPPETVFRAAGLLPPVATPRGLYEEIITHRLGLLSARDLEEVYKFTDYLISKKQGD